MRYAIERRKEGVRVTVFVDRSGGLVFEGGIPKPPESVFSDYEDRCEPALDLIEWVHEVFISEGAPLVNDAYEHLRAADIGILWTNATYVKKGRRVLGEARIGEPSKSNAWSYARQIQQLRNWFGLVPDFLITLDAGFVDSADNASVCALLEHELHHCGQATDAFGMPKFNSRTGRPVFEIKGHDIEEFTGVVERYGMDATRTRAFVEAAQKGPTVGEAQLDGVCGVCMK